MAHHERLLEITRVSLSDREVLAYQSESAYLLEPPRQVYNECTQNRLEFNVMPNCPVSETLTVKEYRIWDRYTEATFDRVYTSSMRKSPDHLIFVSALVHLQKMMYVYVVNWLGLTYDPFAPEQVKFWPTQISFNLQGLTRL